MHSLAMLHRLRVRHTLRDAGHMTHGHEFAGGSIDPTREQWALELPVDTRFQKPLRATNGTRNYPADYLGADGAAAW